MFDLSYPTYLDKVHGGWIGKCIGGAIGALQENNKSLMNYTVSNVFPAKIPPNDDLDLQVLYLQEVLEKTGARITSRGIGEAFKTYNLCLANEYSVAIKNMELGIYPPWSGRYNNPYFQNSMGCPIRSELWAFICPGDPDAAVRYAHMDGVIDHADESIYAEQFYAALEACSFVESDMQRLIHLGLAYVPQDRELYRCVHFVLDLHRMGGGWREARQQLVGRFGSCDASYSVINVGITILALLYGAGDFTETMLIAVNCGYDTDCTAATAGAILGVVVGASRLPDFWLKQIGEDVVIGTVDIQRYSNKIIDLAKDTCAAGLSLARDGIIPTVFSDVPDGVSPSLPLPKAQLGLAISVRYSGVPSIGVEEPATVQLTVSNCSAQKQEGDLIIAPPTTLSANLQACALSLTPGSSVSLDIVLAVKENTEVLPQRNLIQVSFVQNGVVTASDNFGLSGAARMKLLGPFWDEYDTTQHDQNPYGSKMQRRPDGTPDLYSMFNGFVQLDRPYVDETFVNVDQEQGVYVDFHEDRLDLSTAVGYQGPCCVYLIHDVFCPEDRDRVELLVGNNDGYKLWLNGACIMQGQGPRRWMPYNDYRQDVSLTKGVNRFIFKLVRSGDHCWFSYAMRSEETKWHLFTDLGSVIGG